jgi:drug/metabolite transporter (DMT)-like permease
MMAWIFLDEEMTLGVVIGIVLALIGPLLMFERRVPAPQLVAVTTVPEGDPVLEAPAQVEPVRIRQMEGYVFAVLCAIGYGTSPVLIRSALEGHSGVSILGGLTAYTAAAALLIASLLLPSRRGLVAALNLQTMRAFFAAGFFVFLAQMLNFIALTLASVAVVATLLRFSNVFTLMISWVYNRRLEMITPRTVLGVSFSVTGAIVMVFA